MNARQIIWALQSGETLVMRGRGTREEEATLAELHARGLLYVDRSRDGRALIIRWRRKRLVRVRVVEPTWYGWRVTEQLMEVDE